MEKKEVYINRWAEYIVPAVLHATAEFDRLHPEWAERLKNPGDDPEAVANEYCTAIATLIVEKGYPKLKEENEREQ